MANDYIAYSSCVSLRKPSIPCSQFYVPGNGSASFVRAVPVLQMLLVTDLPSYIRNTTEPITQSIKHGGHVDSWPQALTIDEWIGRTRTSAERALRLRLMVLPMSPDQQRPLRYTALLTGRR